MAIARSCNRCGAPVEKALDPLPRLVVVPAASPATRPVAADVDCQIGIVTGVDADTQPIDYCGPCLLSVVMARALSTGDVALATSAAELVAAQRNAVAGLDPIAEPGAVDAMGKKTP